MSNLKRRPVRKNKNVVAPRFVYRQQPGDSENCRTFEIGECDSPRTYDAGWCDRRVCEGFWGGEELCRQTVEAMNRHVRLGVGGTIGKVN
jgi:hypothetical protein